MTNTSWSYFVPAAGVDPGPDFVSFWRETDYNDAAWPTGFGLFGTESTPYGYPINTPVPPPASGPATTYYRARFNWSGATANLILTGVVRIDDGCVIYVNGQEGYRFNMPAGAPLWSTFASRANPGGEPVIQNIQFPGINVFEGENLVAVEVHNNSATSSDVVFGLSLSGDISQPPGITTQPVGTNVLQGRPFTLTVVATGLPTPTYQWYKNGVLLPGATAASYTVASADPDPVTGSSGSYFVRITNPSGSLDSDTVTVNVSYDTEGPLFVLGSVLSGSRVRLEWSEVMSNTYDPFSVFVYETANQGNTYGLTDNVLANNGLALEFNTTPALTPGVNYSVWIGVGGFQDQFGNLCAQEEVNPFDPGIVRTLASEIPIADYGTEWSYFPLYGQPGAELITSSPPFYSLAFDDSAWPKGLPPFGVENPLTTMPDNLDVVTPVQNTGSGGPTTTYYRLRFDLDNPADVLSMRLARVLYDDGIVVYLNGVEVGRTGVAANQNSATFGTSHQADAYSGQAWTLPTTNLYEADNILAVELHNTSTGSTDNIWAAELRAVVGTIVINPPAIEDQTPGPVNLNEGQRLTLSVTASGSRPLSYEWRLGGSPILNATNASYTVASVTTANAGIYTCVVNNSSGMPATSAPIQVNVTADTVRPTVVSAFAALDPTIIEINFSEPVTELTATNPANYAVALRAGGGDLTITTADLNNGTNVVLTTSARMVDNYRLTVRNITDLAAAANQINPNPTVLDLASEVILVDHAAFGEWRYDDTIATAPPVDWATPAFDATSWKTGLPLFYGKRGTPGNTSIPTLTTLNLSNALNTAQLTSVYFRVSINLTAGQVANTPLKFQYILDDGAVFYANGTEVLRVGMPPTPTPPLNSTFANRTVGNDMLWEDPVIVSGLAAGATTFAAEVHQVSATSSDLAFALRLIGTQATIIPPLRITSITVEGGNVTIRHNGASVPGDEYVQAATSLADPPSGTAWVTQPGGPHASPYNAGPATGMRFFRLKDRP